MKPLSIAIQGFRSHLHRTEIDFEGRRLIAIVGPIGSGKSSILDGICFALYGKTPKVGHEIKTLISSRAEAAEIEFRFEADGREFTVERSIRNKGQGQVVLTDDAGEKVMGKRDVDQRIEELVGLDFKAFCSSVILPQGQFARFLESEPSHRDNLLKGLFRFDKLDDMKEIAKARVTELDIELKGLANALAELPDDANARLEELEDEAHSSEERATYLAGLRPKAAALNERSAAAQASLVKAHERITHIEMLSLPEEAALDELVVSEREIAEPHDDAQKNLESVAEAVLEAEALAAKVIAENGSEGELASLRALEAKRVELEGDITRLREEIESLSAAQEAAASQVEKANANEGRARETLTAAQEALREAQDKHAAHGLRGALEPGEPCPVCEQAVAVLPKAVKVPALEKLEAAWGKAEEALEAARSAVSLAAVAQSSAAATVERAGKDLYGFNVTYGKTETELRKRLGEVADLGKELDERESKLQTALTTLDERRKDRDASAAALKELETQMRALEDRRRSVRDQLVHAGGTLRVERPADIDSSAALGAFRASLAAALELALKTERETENDATALAQSVLDEAAALEAEIGFPVAQLDEQWQTATRKAADTQAAASHLKEKIAAADTLAAKAEGFRRERDVYAGLKEDLRNDRFVRFVLEGKRQLLCELGSVKLLELTDRYRFDASGDFNVVDTYDGDKERGVASLSGGETFLASLALSLGLAEAVSREGGRLQCFFLDEGFGSLDPEALDVALDGIERIVTDDRLIAIVSHVPALAERIEDKVILDRSPEGNTVVKAGATLV